MGSTISGQSRKRSYSESEEVGERRETCTAEADERVVDVVKRYFNFSLEKN